MLDSKHLFVQRFTAQQSKERRRRYQGVPEALAPADWLQVECPAESALGRRLNRLYHYLATYGSDDAAKRRIWHIGIKPNLFSQEVEAGKTNAQATAAATAGCMYVHSKRVWIRWSLAVAQPCISIISISTSMYVSALPFRLSII